MVTHQRQLSWERRMGRFAALAAFAAAGLSVAYLIVRAQVAFAGPVANQSEFLLAVDERSAAFLAAAAVSASSVLLIALAGWYLLRATRYRTPELPAWTFHLLWVGAVLLAATQIPVELDRIDISHEFASSGPHTETRAEGLLEGRSDVLIGIELVGSLVFALPIALVNMYAMRAGLVSRPVGYIGVFVAALYLIPVGGGPIPLQLFWLGALTFLFAGVWPGGRGPAWETGEAARWPRADEIRTKGLSQ